MNARFGLGLVFVSAAVCVFAVCGGAAGQATDGVVAPTAQLVPMPGTTTQMAGLRWKTYAARQFNPHEPRWGQMPHVTDLVISPDGQWLAAAYRVRAMNRPGTDWDAYAAVWDLKTGKRTIIRNAAGPLAISPDGAWLVMGLYERVGMGPKAKPALWKTGEEEPAATLESDVEPNGLAAWTFSSDGKQVLAALINSSRIGVQAWDVSGRPVPKSIQSTGPPQGRGLMGFRGSGGQESWRSSLHAVQNRLILLAPAWRHSLNMMESHVPGVYGAELEWTWNGKEWVTNNSKELKESTPSNMALQHPLAAAGDRPYELSLPRALSQPYLEPGPSTRTRWPDYFAFAPKDNLVAFRSSEAGLAVVRKVRGDVVSQFPAAQVHAFTPGGKQLVVSDNRGILRFRDVATGRIVRTLRLDDKPAETFKVAAIQAVSQFGRPEENRNRLGGLVEQAARAGAQVVVLPETAVTGYMSADIKQTWQTAGRAVTEGLTGVDPKDAGETVPGPSTEYFGKLAARHGIYLTVGLLEADRKAGRYYNTVVLLGPDGRMLIHYRKLNPWPFAETGWATAGNLGRPVADTPLGRLGVLICFDIHKQAAELAALKVDTLLYSIAWVEDAGSEWFPKSLPAVAKECGFNIVGANWAVPKDADPAWHGFGQSVILTAAGQAVGRASDGKGDRIIYAELPLPER